jgi:metal-responsive CopG/Arc/MetJ family transcriptional regulator
MKRPKRRRPKLSKSVKLSISLPEDMVDYIDEIAEVSEVSRSEVIQWVFNILMTDEEIEALIFPEEAEEEEEDFEEEEEEED